MAKGSYQSLRGTISSNWNKVGSSFTLQVSVPANTQAEIWIPSKENVKITESGKPLQNQKLVVKKYESGYAVVEVQSGDYRFKSEL
jgi:alpha-L-rhamnosidase